MLIKKRILMVKYDIFQMAEMYNAPYLNIKSVKAQYFVTVFEKVANIYKRIPSGQTYL